MTEDYTGIISLILSVTVGVYWIHSFFSGYNGSGQYEPITDNFRIGYIEPEPQKVIVSNNNAELTSRIKDLESLVKDLKKELQKRPKRVYKEGKQPKVQPEIRRQKQPQKQNTNENLQTECSLALQALGYKTREADRAAKSFLENTEVKDVQDFIVKFFKDKK